MGSCLCLCRDKERDTSDLDPYTPGEISIITPGLHGYQHNVHTLHNGAAEKYSLSEIVDKLVKETLEVIASIVDE